MSSARSVSIPIDLQLFRQQNLHGVVVTVLDPFRALGFRQMFFSDITDSQSVL